MKRKRDSEAPDLFTRIGADGGGTPSLPNAVRGRVAVPSATADVPDGGGTPSLPGAGYGRVAVPPATVVRNETEAR